MGCRPHPQVQHIGIRVIIFSSRKLRRNRLKESSLSPSLPQRRQLLKMLPYPPTKQERSQFAEANCESRETHIYNATFSLSSPGFPSASSVFYNFPPLGLVLIERLVLLGPNIPQKHFLEGRVYSGLWFEEVRSMASPLSYRVSLC